MHTTHKEACRKKAYEIALALFRVGKYAPDAVRRHFEDRGLSLVSSASQGRFEEVKSGLIEIEYLLKLGIEGGYLSREEEQIIYSEVAGLFSFILKEYREPAAGEREELGSIFKPMEVAESRNPAKNNSAIVLPNNDKKELSTVPKENKSPSSEIRQTTILQRIRQFGNCRLKDLQDVLPDVSERTLRYDLQELVTRGAIRRVGSGGPGTFYESMESGAEGPESTPLGEVLEA